MDKVEVAVIDSRRCIRLDAAVGYSNGSVVPGRVAEPCVNVIPVRRKDCVGLSVTLTSPSRFVLWLELS